MAEFENNHCTGCGYKVNRYGHRPYCWRLVSALSSADTGMKFIRRCLKQMNKHHKFISLFLARKEHIYYTIESIDNGVAEEAKNRGIGYYKCNSCGYAEISENEVLCWQCPVGEMIYTNQTG